LRLDEKFQDFLFVFQVVELFALSIHFLKLKGASSQGVLRIQKLKFRQFVASEFAALVSDY